MSQGTQGRSVFLRGVPFAAVRAAVLVLLLAALVAGPAAAQQRGASVAPPGPSADQAMAALHAAQETARKMVKAVKGHGFKKVQVQIQVDELRVTSPSKDELQQVMALLKGEDWGMELQFGNYR